MLGVNHGKKHGLSFYEVLALPPEEIDGFEQLIDRYMDTVTALEPLLWGYVELDQGGPENKRRLRAMTEAKGLRPIPVYHPLVDDYAYFDELAGQYDRICMANVVVTPRPMRKRLLATLWERCRAYPHLWVHLLGYTPDDVTNAYPAASVDSSTFLGAVRWGNTWATSMNLPVSRMPFGMNYKLDRSQKTERGGQDDAYRAAGYQAAMDQRAWSRTIADYKRHGLPQFPDEVIPS
jgi:hypothetical protein